VNSTTSYVRKQSLRQPKKMQWSATEWCNIVQEVSVSDDDDDVFVKSCNFVVLGYVLSSHWWEHFERYTVEVMRKCLLWAVLLQYSLWQKKEVLLQS